MLFRRMMGMVMPLSADKVMLVSDGGWIYEVKLEREKDYLREQNILLHYKKITEDNGAKFLFVTRPYKMGKEGNLWR